MLGQKDKLLLGVKQLALFGAVLGLVFGTGAISYGDAFADGKDKIEICHKGKTKEVSEKSLEKHLKHGDTEDKCDDDKDDKGHGKGKFKHVLRGDGPPPEKLGKKGDLYFDTWDIDGLDYYVKIGKKDWEFRGIIVEVNSDCDSDEIIKFDGTKWMCADNDFDPVNELQTLSQTAIDVTLSQGGGTVSVDPDSTNELQTLSQSGSDVTLSQGGGTVSIDDDDADPANELQKIKITTKSTADPSDPEAAAYDLTPDGLGGIPITDSISCDAGQTAIGFHILWVSSNGTPVIKSLTFNGATADFTIGNSHGGEEPVDVNVMVICSELILVNP